jgi:hypothetical protein
MTPERAVEILSALQRSLTHVDIGPIDGKEVHSDEIVEALDLAMQSVEEAHHPGIEYGLT